MVLPEQAVASGLFAVRQAVAAGVPNREMRRLLACGKWVRREHGIIEVAGRPPHPLDAVLLAVLRAGPRAVVADRSAAQLHGWDLLVAPPTVELVLPWGAKSRVPHRKAEVEPCDIVALGALPVTSAVRTAVDLAARLPRTEAVVAVDSALRARAVSLGQLEQAWLVRPSMPGHAEAREVLDLADVNSGSVPETIARLLFGAAGLPAPVCQYIVTSDGHFVARTDFAWPWAWLIVEIDGFAYHSDRDSFQRDRERQNALVQLGWRVLRFTVEDLRLRPRQVAAEVAAALAV